MREVQAERDQAVAEAAALRKQLVGWLVPHCGPHCFPSHKALCFEKLSWFLGVWT